MLILILEDDSFKSDHLTKIVNLSVTNADIRVVSDLASAVVAISQCKFDLILVDMALPSHPVVSGGGAPLSLLTGGLEVLFELRSLNRSDACIIITQYPEIEIAGRFYSVDHSAAAIREQFMCDVVGCFQYVAESTEWSEKLIQLIKRYENTTT